METYKKIDFEKPCEECIRTHKRLLKRKYCERQLINDLEKQEGHGFFVINSEWLIKWKLYLCHDTDEDKFMKHYFFDSFEVPGPILNAELLNEEETELREGLENVGLADGRKTTFTSFEDP